MWYTHNWQAITENTGPGPYAIELLRAFGVIGGSEQRAYQSIGDLLFPVNDFLTPRTSYDFRGDARRTVGLLVRECLVQKGQS